MAMIEIKNLNKWYGNFQVLKNCNVTVEKGRSRRGLRPLWFGQIDFNQNC